MKYTQNQQAAIDSRSPLTVVIAGPGSGKTATTIGRIHSDFQRLPLRSVAAITFTNAAASELKRRLVEIGSPLPSYVGTLHGFCLKMLNRGRETPLNIIDPEFRKELIKHLIKSLNIRGVSMESVNDAITALPTLSPLRVSPSVELVARKYRRTLKEAGSVDYDLILFEAWEWLQTFRTGLGAIYVDEFQDSGGLDLAIYDRIEGEKFIVGDLDQAIYGFRGGKVQNLLEIMNRPNAKVVTLEENFRSLPGICEAADKLIQSNLFRSPKTMIPTRSGCAWISFTHYASAEAERTGIAETIQRAITVGGIPPEEIAILCRYNNERKDFKQALIAYGIPVAQNKPPEPPDWGRAVETLAVACNPGNRLAIAALIVREGGNIANALKTDSSDGFHCYTTNDFMRLLETNRFSAESRAKMQNLIDTAAITDLSELLLAARSGQQTFGRGPGVTVATIHAAKGLEWHTVFCPCWNQETFPGNKRGPDLEEERRLAFVAITRARDRLELSTTTTGNHAFTGAVEQRTPSQFVREATV